MKKTFAQEVDAAQAAAVNAAAPFVPSRAEREAAMHPLLARLLAMPDEQAKQYVRETYRGPGTMDAVFVQMFKDAKVPA